MRASGTRWARLVITAGGLGRCPVAPGTVASAAAAVVGYGLLMVSAWALAAATLGATLLGLHALRMAKEDDDPGYVVIDEVAGQWLALALAGAVEPVWALTAFALFRLFDIAKTGPVGWADRQPNAWGIMGDDLIAGALAGLVVAASRAAIGLL